MSALICGSLAYDTIMVFQDQFKNHILPDKVHILNVSFLVPRMRREFGGCAGNIAYNLQAARRRSDPDGDRRPGLRPVPRSGSPNTASTWTRSRRSPELFTAAGVHHHRPRRQPDHRVPSGRDDAQLREPRARRDGVTFGIVAPDGRDAMLQHATRVRRAAFPSSSIPARRCRCSTARSSAHFIEQADYVIVNDYESNLLQERTGWNEEDIASQGQGLHHHPRPEGLAHPHARQDARSRLRTSAASPIRPVAAMPTAPA